MIQPRTLIALKITLITIPAASSSTPKSKAVNIVSQSCANALAQRHARLASSHYPGVEEVEYVAEFCDRKQRGGEKDRERWREELVGDTGGNGVGVGDGGGGSKGGRT